MIKNKNSKIIGFLISKKKFNKKDVDFFNIGLNYITEKVNNMYLFLWGVGKIRSCKINENTYAFSFPLKKSLNDRNLLITIKDNEIIIENDWLGSIPVFFNEKKGIVSSLVNMTIDQSKIKHSSTGIYNFLKFGYSVFNKTILENIKFMSASSKLIIKDSKLIIKEKNDNLEELRGGKQKPSEVFKTIEKYLKKNIEKISGNIILPLSGGFDSRLLAEMINNENVYTYTFGITKNQKKSRDVVYAREIAKKLGLNWEQIYLKNFYCYTKKWFDIFGIATHLHGMYQIEFYKKIYQKLGNGSYSLLSGIFGDIWAGSLSELIISDPEDLVKLGYTHGIDMDPGNYLLNLKDTSFKNYYEKNYGLIQNSFFQPIFVVRLKIILISYLMIIPDYLGFPSWTPFLNKEVVRSMLNLAADKKRKRKWQIKYFQKKGIYPENKKLKYETLNELNYLGLDKLKKIDIDFLDKYFKRDLLRWSNNILFGKNIFNNIKRELLYKRKIGTLLRNLGFRDYRKNALSIYRIVKVIEMVNKKYG